MTPTPNTETICALPTVMHGFGERRVIRTFRTRETAWRWANAQNRHVSLRVVAGRLRPGDAVKLDTPTRAL
jgi:hypothetical protein